MVTWSAKAMLCLNMSLATIYNVKTNWMCPIKAQCLKMIGVPSTSNLIMMSMDQFMFTTSSKTFSRIIETMLDLAATTKREVNILNQRTCWFATQLSSSPTWMNIKSTTIMAKRWTITGQPSRADSSPNHFSTTISSSGKSKKIRSKKLITQILRGIPT